MKNTKDILLETRDIDTKAYIQLQLRDYNQVHEVCVYFHMCGILTGFLKLSISLQNDGNHLILRVG